MNLLTNLGIKKQMVTANRVVITLRVSDRVKQPYGIVHGGINAILGETAASLGAQQWLHDHHNTAVPVGLNITTQHLRVVTAGEIRAVAVPAKCGRRLQTWTVRTFNNNVLTSLSTVSLLNQDRTNE